MFYMKPEDIRPAALALPMRERAKLARELLESLEHASPNDDVEDAWIQEIDRRVRGLDSGERQAVEWSVARERIARRLRERRAARARS